LDRRVQAVSGSDRTVAQSVDPYTPRTEHELAVEAEVHAAAERLIRRHEKDDPEMMQRLLQMVGFAESPPSKKPSWEKRRHQSRAKAKAVPDAVE
jgi:hypothetical protein